jgi:hypothetical protein
MPKFFDQYTTVPSGLSYVGKDEKAVLIREGAPLTIHSISKQPDQFNPGKDRYVLTVELDGEQRGMAFGAGTVFSRDALLESMAEYLTGETAEPVTVKLVQAGRAILIEEAE